jgi:hypothetical protein
MTPPFTNACRTEEKYPMTEEKKGEKLSNNETVQKPNPMHSRTYLLWLLQLSH